MFYIPEKITLPSKPTLLKYNTQQKMDSPENFKKLQQNTVFLIDYANALKDVISHYELTIDQLTQQKDQMKTSQENE